MDPKTPTGATNKTLAKTKTLKNDRRLRLLDPKARTGANSKTLAKTQQLKNDRRLRVVEPKARLLIDSKKLAKPQQKNTQPRIQLAPRKTPDLMNAKNLAKTDVKKGAKDQTGVTNQAVATPKTIEPAKAASLRRGNADVMKGFKTPASELAQVKDVMGALEASKNAHKVNTNGVAFGLLPSLRNPGNSQDPADATPETPAGNGSGLVTPGSGMFGDPLKGAGVDYSVFDFLGTSHGAPLANAPNSGKTADAAKGAVGVTPGSIARGIAGINGSDTHIYGTMGSGRDYQRERFYRGTRVLYRGTRLGDGTYLQETITSYEDGDSTYHWTLWNRTRTRIIDGHVPHVEPVRPYVDYADQKADKKGADTADTKKPGKDVAKLYDPDYVGGGGHPFHWLDQPQETVADKVNRIGPGGLTPGTDNSQPDGRTGGTPIISMHDVLSTYDPDSTDRGTPTPIDGCMHEEC